MQRQIERSESIDVSALTRHYLAQSHYHENEYVTARTIALKGLEAFPESVGGRRCKNLIANIEGTELSIRTERIWNPVSTKNLAAEIMVDYRNIETVYFRLVPFDALGYLRSNRYQPENLDTRQRDHLLNQQSTLAWSVKLGPTEDYLGHSQRLRAPRNVPKGTYFLIASRNPDFTTKDNQIDVSEVWVSDLALVTRNSYRSPLVDGFVVNAQSGAPEPGVTVTVWTRQRDGTRVATREFITDHNGHFKVALKERQQALFVAQKGPDRVSSSRFLRYRSQSPDQVRTATRFFTDRSIYRPGQTIQYKGICHRYDQENDRYETTPNQKRDRRSF